MSQSHVFTIRSRARESGTPTDFVYVTEAVPEDSSLHDAIYLQSFLMPVTTYVVDGTHRTIRLVEGPATHVVNLSEGNYSADQLASEITSKINAVAVDTYSMTLNRRTGKYSINKLGVSPHAATLAATTQRLAFVLGLELVDSLAIPVNGTATFPACANLKPSPSILVICDLAADGVLANVPAPNVPPFSFVNWQYSGDSSGAKELGRTMRGAVPVGVRIVDSELGETLNLNGSDGIELTIVTFQHSTVAARIADLTLLMQRLLKYFAVVEEQRGRAIDTSIPMDTGEGASDDDAATGDSAPVQQAQTTNVPPAPPAQTPSASTQQAAPAQQPEPAAQAAQTQPMDTGPLMPIQPEALATPTLQTNAALTTQTNPAIDMVTWQNE